MITAPVLLITFNRPQYTQQVFNAIKTAKPSKLYIFNDGPRKGNEKDILARNEITEITKQIDWQCQLHINFAKENLGCGQGPVTAINWAFENEDRLIILEDDTVPVIPFFKYCDTLLEKYKDEKKIFMISGNNNSIGLNNTIDSYFFSIYGYIPGWATWKRAWAKYDFWMKEWPQFKNSERFNIVFKTRIEKKYFRKYFDNIFNLLDKSTWWDHQWFFCRVKEYGLSIVPQANLIENIGIIGTHSSTKSKIHNSIVKKDYTITQEPPDILINEIYERNHFDKLILKNKKIYDGIAGRIFRKLKKLLK